MKSPILFLAVILTAFETILAGAISPEEAKGHIGETMTVRGRVEGVHVTTSDTLLTMGGIYPREIFAIVSFRDNGIPLHDLSAFEGKTISVSGKVELYHGRPEIVLATLGQISVP